MGVTTVNESPAAATESVLQAYLLGTVDFEVALRLQRRLVYQIGEDRSNGALILCEHSPLITVGRHGSRAHIFCESDELRARSWPVRWVNRGGGCLLHLPGQMAVYAIMPLDQLGFGLHAYLSRLQEVFVAVLKDFGVSAEVRPEKSDVWVKDRPVACLGVAVRDWTSYYGAVFNVYPDLEPFRLVRTGRDVPPMTSLERERRGPLHPSLVRERLLEHFASYFGFSRTSIFFDHPAISYKSPSGAVISRS